MRQAASVFIMDIAHSSSLGNWNEVTEHLQGWEKVIQSWCGNVVKAKVSHRRGDEILFVAEHYMTAFTIAVNMALQWKFVAQQPYFGISYGFIEENLDDLDIEIWNHPLIKQARLQSEKIKTLKKRETSIIFSDHLGTKRIITTPEILNLLAETLWKLRQKQSENQKIVCSLSYIYKEQKKIASLLHKTPSTISIQYSKGESELFRRSLLTMIKMLCSEESGENTDHALIILMHELDDSIRTFMENHLGFFYPDLGKI